MREETDIFSNTMNLKDIEFSEIKPDAEGQILRALTSTWSLERLVFFIEIENRAVFSQELARIGDGRAEWGEELADGAELELGEIKAYKLSTHSTTVVSNNVLFISKYLEDRFLNALTTKNC